MSHDDQIAMLAMVGTIATPIGLAALGLIAFGWLGFPAGLITGIGISCLVLWNGAE